MWWPLIAFLAGWAALFAALLTWIDLREGPKKGAEE